MNTAESRAEKKIISKGNIRDAERNDKQKKKS